MNSTRWALLRLAAAAPTFTPDWDELEPLDYVDVGDLSDHLQGQLKTGATEEVAAVFRTVEELLAEGDAEVENFVKIGLFESIQNTCPGRGLTQEMFEPFLGPRSMAVWLDLNNMWGGSTSGD